MYDATAIICTEDLFTLLFFNKCNMKYQCGLRKVKDGHEHST
jgi:hypothetical protein